MKKTPMPPLLHPSPADPPLAALDFISLWTIASSLGRVSITNDNFVFGKATRTRLTVELSNKTQISAESNSDNPKVALLDVIGQVYALSGYPPDWIPPLRLRLWWRHKQWLSTFLLITFSPLPVVVVIIGFSRWFNL